MPAILTDEDIGLDASPSVSLSDEDIGLTEDHKIVRPPKPGTPPPGYLTPEEIFKSQEKTGLFGGLAEGFTAPMKATARGVGLATLPDETLQEHLLGEYWKATASPEMTGLGKAGQLIGGLAGTVAQAIPVAAGGARIGGPVGAKAAVMAQFGSMGAYDEFIKAGSQALAEGKTPEEATAIGKKAAIAGAGVGAVMGAVAPGAGQGAMDVLKSAAKMGLVGGAGRGIQNITERTLGLSTPVTQDVAKEAAIMALLPAGMGLARFGFGKLFPPPPIEPEVLPAVVPKRPSGGPGTPVERAPLALPEPTIPDAEIILPAQLQPPSGTAWPITPPPPRVPPRLTMPIPMGQGEIPVKTPRTLAEVEAMLRTLKEQEPPSEEPPTGEAGVPVGREPEPPAPISPAARGPQPTEAPAEPSLQPAPEVAAGEKIVAPETTIPEPPKEMFHGTRTAGTLKIGQGKNLNTQGLWLSDYESKASEFSEGRPSDEGIASVRSVEFTPSKTKKVYGPDLKHTDANDLIKQGYDSVYVPDTGFWIALKESAFKEKQPTKPKAEYAVPVKSPNALPVESAPRSSQTMGEGIPPEGKEPARTQAETGEKTEAPVALKQPWEMTRQEYVNSRGANAPIENEEFVEKHLGQLKMGEPGLSVEGDKIVFRDKTGLPVGVTTLKTVAGEKVVDNTAVDSDYRRQGIATKLYAKAKSLGYATGYVENVASAGAKHKLAVKEAIESGKPVPTEVLKDYPELQSKAQPPSKPAEGGGGEVLSPSKVSKRGDIFDINGEKLVAVGGKSSKRDALKLLKIYKKDGAKLVDAAGKYIVGVPPLEPVKIPFGEGRFRYRDAFGNWSYDSPEMGGRMNVTDPRTKAQWDEDVPKQPTTPPIVGGEWKPAKTLMERYEAGETLSREEQRELRKSIAATDAETPEVKAETGKRGKTLKEIREAEERRKQEGSFTLQPLEPFVRKAAEHLDKLRAEMGILLRNGKMLEVMTYKKDAANNAAQQYARRIKNGLGKSLFDATGTKYDPFKESRSPTTVRTILMPWEDPHGVQKTALTVGQESFSEAPPNSPEAGVTGLPRLQMQRQKLVAWQPPNEKLGKWKNSLMEGLDYAIANWNRIEPTVRRYDAEMRMQAQAEVNAKVDTLIRSGYVMHAQDVQGLSDFDFLTGRGSGEAASFLKKRYHPTYVDSVMAGVEPRSLDALALAETRIRLGQQKINSRAWTQELRSMTDKTSGNPILTEPQWETRADGKEYPVRPTKDYEIVYMGFQPFAIHKGYETAFKDLTSPSAFTDSLTGRTLLRAAAGTKHIVLAFDTFHLGRLALWSAIYNKGLPAYKKGFVLLDNTVSDLRDMAQRGDIPAEYLNDILENKRKIGLAFKTGYNVTRIQDALWQDWMQKLPVIGPFNKFLFGQFQRGAMMQAWLTEFERQRKEFPWLSESDVARKVSKSLNTRFGNLQSQGVFRSKTMQDVARMLFLAPQWNEGLIRSEVGAAKELGEVGSNAILRRKFAVGTLLRGIGILFAAQFAANQLINFATRGHSTLDNPEEGLDAKMSAYIPDVVGEGPGLFISPMALPLETTHLIGKKLEKTDDFDEAFRAYARTRLGTLARPLNTWWTGKDVFGKPIREGELWGELLKDATPAPISGSAAFHAGRQVLSGEKAEQFPGQFQRQAMASFGMKTEGAPTAAQQIGALAQKFNKARGQREIPKQFADYAELDRLLRVGNYKDAQKALDELRTKRKDKDIINRFKVKASSGFTHGSKAVEGQFYNTLTEEQKTAYFNARKEQQDLVSRFYKLWAQSPKQP